MKAIITVDVPKHQIGQEVSIYFKDTMCVKSVCTPLTEYMQKKYDERTDKDNMFGVGITDAEFRAFIIDYLLGSDWYVVDPLGQTQINEIALCEILEKYSKKYRKEIRGKENDLSRM